MLKILTAVVTVMAAVIIGLVAFEVGRENPKLGTCVDAVMANMQAVMKQLEENSPENIIRRHLRMPEFPESKQNEI